MAALVSSMAKEIFQLLKGTGRTISLFDVHGNKIFEPEEANSFFAEPDKLMISINKDGSNSSLNMYVSGSAEIDELKKLINNLRSTANRHNFLFNIRKYGRDLEPKDFAYQAEPMMESMWGSAKTSYQNIGQTKLIIRHSTRISEEVRGARSRRIHAIFIETQDGQRFKCPMNSLHGARAFAKHLDSGGTPNDNFSNYIFSECALQEKINTVRKHIRRLNSTSDNIMELSETLTGIVRESKARVAKSKGNRFYTGIVEQITNAPNYVGPLLGEVQEKIQELCSVLDIDETNSLFPVLESVAKTILETRMMEPINFEEQRLIAEFVAENQDLIADLVETLVGEFGLEENIHFYPYAGNKIALINEDAINGARMYLEGLQLGELVEATEDKFLTYAKSWVANRFKSAGMDQREIEQAGLDKQAEELALGLKMVVANRLNVSIKAKEMPKFTDPAAAISFKLSKLLEPSAGIKNDMLWNFISNISDKITNDTKLDANERFFAQRLADIVDKASAKVEAILPELNELEEWMNGFGLNEADPYDDIGDDRKVEEILDYFELDACLDEIIPQLGVDMASEYAEDRSVSKNSLFNLVQDHILGICEDNHITCDINRYEPMIDSLVDEKIIPALKARGIEVVMTEGFDMSVFEEDLDEAGPYDDIQMDRKIEHALDNFDMDEFFEFINSDLNRLMDFEDRDDRYVSKNSIFTLFTDFIAKFVNDPELEIERYEDQLDKVFDVEIIPALEKIGVTVTMSEGFDMSVFEEDLAEAHTSMDPAVKELVAKALSQISARDYYGIVSGDDADDDLYNLLHTLKTVITNDLDLSDYAEEIKQMAHDLWTKEWNKNESLEEAGNMPDDYNASRDPHAKADPSDELYDELTSAMEEVLDNPPKDSILAKVTSDWFDGEADDDLVADIAGDVIGFAVDIVDRAHEEEVGNGYWLDHQKSLKDYAAKLVRQKYLTVDEALRPSDYARQTNAMQLQRIISTLPSFIKYSENPTVDQVFNKVNEFYMDSQTSGPIVVQNERLIRNEIGDLLGLNETADQGNDFIDDVTYSTDRDAEADMIARLRKLAGI